MIKVSIIVPVYNVEKYLAKCLESLVNQTLEEIEIIVINDSSPDCSQEIIDEFQKKYPDKIKSYTKPNGGIADVRNFGLTKVTGEYFGFLDSDDYVELDMYQKLYNVAKSHNSELVISKFYWEYPNKTVLGKDGPYQVGKDMLIHMMATLWNKLYKTEFIRSLPVQFPTGYRYEDAYFLYCITPYIQKVNFLETPFVHYMQRIGSITHQNDERVKDMIHVFEALSVFYQKQNLLKEYQNELEYLFIRFFLGNSFLRTIQIQDKDIRNKLINTSWKFLNQKYPNWKKNPYLKSEKGMKSIYFRGVSSWNIKILAVILRPFVMHKEKSLYQ